MKVWEEMHCDYKRKSEYGNLNERQELGGGMRGRGSWLRRKGTNLLINSQVLVDEKEGWIIIGSERDGVCQMF